MKKILFTFLMFSVFSSTLMCGMSVCVNAAQAGTSSPCHGGGGHADGDDLNSLMRAADCAGIEFQTLSDTVLVESQRHSFDNITYALVDEKPFYSFQYADENTIRGPPDPGGIHSGAQRPLILTTQRFLI